MTFQDTLISRFPALGDECHEKWGLIPDYMRGGIIRYVLHGIPPGGFLSAVISNDLSGAVLKADRANINLLDSYASFFRNNVPSSSHGHQNAMNDWCEALAKHKTDDCIKPDATEDAA